MSSTTLLTLPTELIVNTLLYLSLEDLSTCLRTCRTLNNIINQSIPMRYRIATATAFVEHNPPSNLSLNERLQALKKSEFAWSLVQPEFSKTIKVPYIPSSIYDLTGGVYLLGSHDRLGLHYCTLPRSPSDSPTWSYIHVGETVVDIGLSVYEHDLLVVVTSTPAPINPSAPTLPIYRVELHFLQFSTGQPHPLAKEPKLLVLSTRWIRIAISIEIVGDYLALITTFPANQFQPRDRFTVYDWKEGKTLMSSNVPYNQYSGLVFLTPEILAVPNTLDNSLEMWQIPKTPDEAPTSPICTLSLPELQTNRRVIHVSCRGEPNPMGHGSTSNSPQPFFPSAEDSVIIFNLRVQSEDRPISRSFTFFVHRRSLIDIVARHITEHAERESKRAFEMPGGFETETSIPWEAWGPPVTRWFNTDGLPTRWVTTTAGQRCVLIFEEETPTRSALLVLDFNRYNIRRAAKDLELLRDRRRWCSTKEDQTDPFDSFKAPIRSSLPYVGCVSENAYQFDGALIDEERIIGLRTNSIDRITEIEVLYFG